MSDHLYHLQSLLFGAPAGLAALTGIALLINRRRTRSAVFMATTRSDKLMYLVLVCAAGGRSGLYSGRRYALWRGARLPPDRVDLVTVSGPVR
ncbi:respiratory nitrate reductase subunit gamma [Mycobacterium leprae]|uniref:respiratory nitrate reductase subunit gamma n=1 Tax=Mycobacterium leprae TaxID=1769 RepID=UPI00031D772C